MFLGKKQVHKWVPDNLMMGAALHWQALCPEERRVGSGGGGGQGAEMLLVAPCYRNRLDGPLSSHTQGLKMCTAYHASIFYVFILVCRVPVYQLHQLYFPTHILNIRTRLP